MVRRTSEYLLQGRESPELPYFSANSTAMRAVPMKERLKYLTACSASSTVRKPTKPNWRELPSLHADAVLEPCAREPGAAPDTLVP